MNMPSEVLLSVLIFGCWNSFFVQGISITPSASASCSGRCGTPDFSYPCQCNRACEKYNDCCDDYIPTCNPGALVTDNEIQNITNTLWLLDINRIPATDITINVTGDSLFTYVNESHFSNPTFATYIALLDNYIANTSTAEPQCDICRQEENDFLNAILQTELMQRTWKFLADRGLASNNSNGFKEELKKYWFKMYSRSKGTLGSSGFEHVFVGEIKRTSVKGFHSWVQFYLEEKAGKLDYKTHLGNCEPAAIRLSLNWQGYFKRISSIYISSSPEFDMAIFTICFLTRAGRDCNISLDGYSSKVKTWDMSRAGVRMVGTAYPKC